mmetsp:Transcript_10483/g.27193  ORF Transcript_10483/g.27193 Transcript_10483/m.27193 type:complete len:264 (-) Transcript_10483:175-966(-)
MPTGNQPESPGVVPPASSVALDRLPRDVMTCIMNLMDPWQVVDAALSCRTLMAHAARFLQDVALTVGIQVPLANIGPRELVQLAGCLAGPGHQNATISIVGLEPSRGYPLTLSSARGESGVADVHSMAGHLESWLSSVTGVRYHCGPGSSAGVWSKVLPVLEPVGAQTDTPRGIGPGAHLIREMNFDCTVTESFCQETSIYNYESETSRTTFRLQITMSARSVHLAVKDATCIRDHTTYCLDNLQEWSEPRALPFWATNNAPG